MAANPLFAVSSQIMQRDAHKLPFIAANDKMKLHAMAVSPGSTNPEV